jgi:hypothetical protein
LGRLFQGSAEFAKCDGETEADIESDFYETSISHFDRG